MIWFSLIWVSITFSVSIIPYLGMDHFNKTEAALSETYLFHPHPKRPRLGKQPRHSPTWIPRERRCCWLHRWRDGHGSQESLPPDCKSSTITQFRTWNAGNLPLSHQPTKSCQKHHTQPHFSSFRFSPQHNWLIYKNQVLEVDKEYAKSSIKCCLWKTAEIS